ncbi:hypothetical protein SAMN05421594_4334 [Chryseobacterium oleae]|uniref:Uncharacterized protein n=2 Tax=Chryseobacterium TaxID=59732 RepID=A0A1I5C6Y5_CHROL|nr:hypothetical protein SAMN05421594_4334 [Chryseobacterium oleae]
MTIELRSKIHHYSSLITYYSSFMEVEEILVKPIIAKELLESLQTKIEEEKQVIVHCCFPASPFLGNLIRIWNSTYLLDNQSDHKSKLIHAENITIYPNWTAVPFMQDFWFTLVFSGLPRDCKSFDLKEVIPEEGGFFVESIKRNSLDVYRVKISESY